MSADRYRYWNKMRRWLLEPSGQFGMAEQATTLLRHVLRQSAQSLMCWAILTETFSHGARSCALAHCQRSPPLTTPHKSRVFHV